MSLEKAINHGAHGEHEVKTMDCMLLVIRQLGKIMGGARRLSSVSSVFSVVITKVSR